MDNSLRKFEVWNFALRLKLFWYEWIDGAGNMRMQYAECDAEYYEKWGNIHLAITCAGPID